MPQILCVSPGGHDKIIVMNQNNSVITDVINIAISTSWSRGKSRIQTLKVNKEDITEFKLNGNPWWSTGKNIFTSLFIYF